VLDDIPGIGPKRKSSLMKAFGSVDRLTHATAEEISLGAGVSEALAAKIVSHLQEESQDTS